MALGAFLPMRLPRASPQGSQNFDISPKSRRSGKSQRPYSADVNQLCALEEDARSNASFKKGQSEIIAKFKPNLKKKIDFS